MLERRKRPRVANGQTYRIETACGHLYVTINRDEVGICEVFSTLGKVGGCASAQGEAICRLISNFLRTGGDPQAIIDQLSNIRCPSQTVTVKSCADAIATALKEELAAPQAEPAAPQ